MKKYKAVWKIEPIFELNENGDLEEAEHDKLLDITMNPHDYIEFEEETGILDNEEELMKTTRKKALKIMSFLIGFHEIKENELDFTD